VQKVKRRLRPYLLDAIYPSFRPAASSRPSGTPSVLILPAADGWEGEGPHGFGDEMLMLGLLEGLGGSFSGRVGALAMDQRGDHDIVFHGHGIRLRGFARGWLSSSSYHEFVRMASEYTHFVVIGADVLDGAYGVHNTLQRLRFLELAGRMGLTSSVTGCSFNGTDDRRIRALFQAAEEVGAVVHARDAATLDRFRLFLQRVQPVADLAFLVDGEKFPLSPAVQRIRSLQADWKSDGGIVVGVNLCGWHINDKDRFFGAFIEELSALKESLGKVGLVLLPHDTRTDRWSDLDTLKELRRRIDGRLDIIGAPEDIVSGIAAKQAVRGCDVLLTGRMHLAIAAHDQGVPSVSFGYQGKFEGFYGLYGLGPEWLVDYQQPEESVRVLSQAIERRGELSAAISACRNVIHSASRANAAWV